MQRRTLLKAALGTSVPARLAAPIAARIAAPMEAANEIVRVINGRTYRFINCVLVQF